MTLPFRYTDKVPAFYPADSIVSISDQVQDAEGAVRDLDQAGFGEDLIYVRDEAARNLKHEKSQQVFVQVYRAMQAVMSDELSVIRLYEKKIVEGTSFIPVPFARPDDVDQVDAIKAHHVTLATFLGCTSFRGL